MSDKPKNIICKDIYGKEYSVTANELVFRPSVYGVAIKDGKVLLSKQWDGYDFPGGGVHLGETLHEALVREFKEETGFNVEVQQFLLVKDSFYKPQFDENYQQSILIYYTCQIVGGSLSTEFFAKNEKKYADMAEWVDLGDINNTKFYNSVDNKKVLQLAREVI